MSLDLFATFADRVLERVADVLANRECPWAPSYDECVLLQELRHHQGIAKAISRADLARKLKMHDRAVRDLIRNLRLNFRVQIGASREGGYYLMTNEADCLATGQQLIGQGIEIIRTGMAMRGGKHSVAEILGQLSLLDAANTKEGK